MILMRHSPRFTGKMLSGPIEIIFSPD